MAETQTGKLNPQEKRELTMLTRQLGWEFRSEAGKGMACYDKLGVIVARGQNQDILNVAVLTAARERTGTNDQGEDQTAMASAITDAIAEKLAEANDQIAGENGTGASLTEQLTEITGGDGTGASGAGDGALDTTYGDYIVANNVPVEYKGTMYQPGEYARFKVLSRKNPPWDKAKEAGWTVDQRNARQAFLICQAWERKVRPVLRENGTIDAAKPRGTAGSGATTTTKPRATTAGAPSLSSPRAVLATIPGWMDDATIRDLRFVVTPSVRNPAAGDLSWRDLIALFGDRMATTIGSVANEDDYLMALEYHADAPAWQPSPELRARHAATRHAGNVAIPDSLIAEGKELAEELERDVYLITVGTGAPVLNSRKDSKMREQYADATNAYLIARILPDGTLYRLATPEQLSRASVAPAILAQTTPAIDPASVANVVTPDTASGMTATETERETIAAG